MILKMFFVRMIKMIVNALAKDCFISFCVKLAKLYPYFKRRKNNPRNDLHFIYFKYDYKIHSMIYSTNWVERLNRDYKRATRIHGFIQNPDAAILLLVSMSRKRYERKST